MGNSGQGIYWQGSDKTHRPDETHWMGGLGTWRRAEGCPIPVLQGGHYCWKNYMGPSYPSQRTDVPSLTGLQHRAEGVRRQQFPALRCLLKVI